jgi:transcriptional regulator with XRE-family HTH domain
MASLREVRAERLLSIRELARRAAVAPSTVYLTEAGRTTPRPSVVARLAAVLDVEPVEVEEFRRSIEAAKATVRDGRRARPATS